MKWTDILSGIATIITIFVIGIMVGQSLCGKSGNSLIQQGFRILDEDGYEVEKFSGDDYWTRIPKQLEELHSSD